MDELTEEMLTEKSTIRAVMLMLTNIVESTKVMLNSIEDLQTRVAVLELNSLPVLE